MSNTTSSSTRNQTPSTVFIIWASLMAENFTEAPIDWTNEWNENEQDTSQTVVEKAATDWNHTTFVETTFYNTSANATNETTVVPFIFHPVVWTGSKGGFFVASFVIMAETIIGNLLVVLSVLLEKKLQTPFNFYLLNLALTDLNVGMSVMTLFMIYNLYEYFPFDVYACSYWIWSDYTMTFESVATLAAISIDRLWSVTWSIHYRNNNSGRKSLSIIMLTWIYVNAMWLPAFIYDRVYNTDGPGECAWEPTENIQSVLYVGILGYYLPLAIMLAAYIRIFYVMKRRLNQITHSKKGDVIAVTVSETVDERANEPAVKQPKMMLAAKNDAEIARARREKKAFYTLGHIVIFFLICWIPFYLYFLINPMYPTFFPKWYGEFCYWMAYLNSAVNPLVYGIGNEEFKRAFKKILSCQYFRNS